MTEDTEHEEFLDTLQDIIDLQSAGKMPEAIEMISDNVARYGNRPEMMLLTAVCSYRQNNAGQAIELCEQAHKIDPDCLEVVDSLAVLKVVTGNVSDGLYYAKLATTLMPHPDLPDLLPPDFSNFFKALSVAAPSRHYLDGLYLFNGRQFNDAITEFRAELALNPENMPAVKSLGHALLHVGLPDEALDLLSRYAEANPQDPDVPALSAMAKCMQGDFEAAAAHCRDAIAMAPDDIDILMRVLEAARYFDGKLAGVYDEFIATANAVVAEAAAEIAPGHKHRPKEPGEPVSISMVSNALHGGDQHAFLLPVIEKTDTKAVELTVFQQSPTGGPAFQEFKSKSPNWRRIVDIEDDVLALILSRQETDILVDLCGFSANGRAAVCAARTAPVVTNILCEPFGFKAPGTNVILSDDATIAVDERNLGEGQRIAKTEGGLFALKPPALMDDVRPLPALENGYVTFGARCSVPHFSPNTVAMWSGILNAVDGARLMLGNTRNIPIPTRERVRAMFAESGVAERIDFQESLQTDGPDNVFFHGIDIFLDSTPVNGTIVLCEALWMGVPVVTAKADRRSSVIGASILTSAGEAGWIGNDVDDAVGIAVALARDTDALADKRAGLRETIRNSALMNTANHTAKLYAALKSAFDQVTG